NSFFNREYLRIIATLRILSRMRILLVTLLLSASAAFSADSSKRMAVGDSIPDVKVQTAAGETISLKQLTSAKPSVLIFYRGGWCPFCTRHLKDLTTI